MHLRRLELTDVRSYDHVEVGLEPGVTVLVGGNAQGKTNLVEAIHRAATGTSHRVAGDGPLVRAGREVGVIRCQLETDEGRRRTLEVELASGRRTRLRVDGHDVRRPADAIGVLRSVLFAPESLAVVRDDPAERRRFLDDLLAQRRPAFAAARADFERTLRQRNQLLKQLRGLSAPARREAAGTLGAWTQQLIQHGTQVIAARLAAVRTLAGPTDAFYRELADRPDPVGLAYQCSAGDLAAGAGGDRPVPDPGPIAAALRARLAELEGEELARGISLVGPHRDDLLLTIGPLPTRGYASHGEAWSLALALALATFELLAEIGDRPVVLLDDVFAELDVSRRTRLAEACGRFDQVLVTAAVDADVPLAGPRVEVALAGGVSRLRRRGRDDTAGAA